MAIARRNLSAPDRGKLFAFIKSKGEATAKELPGNSRCLKISGQFFFERYVLALSAKLCQAMALSELRFMLVRNSVALCPVIDLKKREKWDISSKPRMPAISLGDLEV